MVRLLLALESATFNEDDPAEDGDHVTTCLKYYLRKISDDDDDNEDDGDDGGTMTTKFVRKIFKF